MMLMVMVAVQTWWRCCWNGRGNVVVMPISNGGRYAGGSTVVVTNAHGGWRCGGASFVEQPVSLNVEKYG